MKLILAYTATSQLSVSTLALGLLELFATFSEVFCVVATRLTFLADAALDLLFFRGIFHIYL